jgi:hypothetical protein
VRTPCLIDARCKFRIDVQVFGLFIGLPASRYIRRMIVAARLGRTG